MNKKTVIWTIVGVAVFIILVIISQNLKSSEVNTNVSQNNQSQEQNIQADKVEVFVFYATRRCISCITIGKYAEETISEYFQSELDEGKIEFREINIDLPENKELANKFQAGGSSLFINAIYEGKDHIFEDVMVWRLVNNEVQFKNYLKNKLDGLFGKQL